MVYAECWGKLATAEGQEAGSTGGSTTEEEDEDEEGHLERIVE